MGRREIRAVLLVLLAAAVLRVVYMLQYKSGVPYHSALIVDSYYYDAWAQRVAEGRGYGPMPFYMAPLYPYVLAVVYKVAGHHLDLVYALQMILGLGNLVLLYAIGRRIFGHAPALIAMILTTLYAPLVYLEPKILTETLAIALNLLSILLLVRALDRPSVGRFMSAGVALGLSAVCRPNSLITAALVALWLLVLIRRGRGEYGVRHLGVLAVGVLLVIVPVTARNCVVGRDIALITTNAGIVFAQGNIQSADGISTPLAGFSGSIETQQDEEMSAASRALGHRVKASESSSYWLGTGLTYIREHPMDSMRLLARKLVWSLHNGEARCSYNLYLERKLVPVLRLLILPFPLLAGLALFGFLRARRKETGDGSELLGIYILSILLSLLVFSVSSRYRAPMVPALALFAGCGLTCLAESSRVRSLHSLALGAACVILVYLFSLVPYPVRPITAEAPANLGSAYVTTGRTREGVRWLRKALAMDPHNAFAHYRLGTVLAGQGKLSDALEHYSQALKQNFDNAYIHNDMGSALMGQGQNEKAAEHFVEALRITPAFAAPYFNLGLVRLRQGRTDEALSHFSDAARISPGFAKAHFQIGNILAARGNMDEAIRSFKRAVKLNPKAADMRYNLGVALSREHRLDEAMVQYREAVKITPTYAKAHKNLAVVLVMKEEFAEAWKEVKLCRKYGGKLSPAFIAALSSYMPEPKE